MIIGQTLHKNDAASAYYSPWFPLNGNGAIMVLDLISTVGTGTITVTLETKNSEDDDASIIANVWIITATSTVGQSTLVAGSAPGAGVGFLELGRYKYEIGGDLGDAVHFRMLNLAQLTG